MSVAAHRLVKALVDAGLVPPTVTKVVIEADIRGALTVYAKLVTPVEALAAAVLPLGPDAVVTTAADLSVGDRGEVFASGRPVDPRPLTDDERRFLEAGLRRVPG